MLKPSSCLSVNLDLNHVKICLSKIKAGVSDLALRPQPLFRKSGVGVMCKTNKKHASGLNHGMVLVIHGNPEFWSYNESRAATP